MLAGRYSDGPPEGHTGGFGEPSCTDCHMDFEENAGTGSLTVGGLPDTLAPGAVYDLVVLLRHEGMARAGFQMTARTADGNQAGTLTPVDDRAAASEDGGITYLGQTETGSFARGDSLAWTVRWTAPDSASGDFLVHAAANAANGDDSPFEDHVYTGAWTVRTH